MAVRLRFRCLVGGWYLLDRAQHVLVVGPVKEPDQRALQAADDVSARGRVPLDHAAQALADHPSYLKHTGVPDPHRVRAPHGSRRGPHQLRGRVARMAWPGDKAVDEERWDDTPDWRMLDLLAPPGSARRRESTDRLLLRYCDERIAKCDRQLDEWPDATTLHRPDYVPQDAERMFGLTVDHVREALGFPGSPEIWRGRWSLWSFLSLSAYGTRQLAGRSVMGHLARTRGLPD